MCGFVAAVNVRETAPKNRVQRAAERLRHRGPDGSGFRALGGVALAHRRLSIVDVAGGGQPLSNEDGTLALACNGEIYNHAALRNALGERHKFRSGSDSEVILHLYEEHGPDCVHALDGMFAFVLTDGERVLAARDPLGIKPLYMGRDSERALWFASEVKALMGCCDAIQEFPAGHLFTSETGLRRWFAPDWTDTRPTATPFEPAGIRDALERAVEKRLMSDVPLGVFLSGGLDSSLIAALVGRRIEPLHSFSVGLAGAPDLEAARSVAQHLGTVHHERVYSSAEVVSALERVIHHLESYDPALLRSAVPCYFVSRLASQHVKVVLSGEGADEAFAGYRYFRDAEDAAASHRESVRLLQGLHNMNLQRVDRMTMAHGLEGRVPFLDIDFLDLAMALPPSVKVHGPDRPEKWALRRSFEGVLPYEVLWRTKQEFAQGCGSEWTLREHADSVVTDADLAKASRRFPEETPTTKEAYLYRRIFDEIFPGGAARATVGRWRGAFAAPEQETQTT